MSTGIYSHIFYNSEIYKYNETQSELANIVRVIVTHIHTHTHTHPHYTKSTTKMLVERCQQENIPK